MLLKKIPHYLLALSILVALPMMHTIAAPIETIPTVAETPNVSDLIKQLQESQTLLKAALIRTQRHSEQLQMGLSRLAEKIEQMQAAEVELNNATNALKELDEQKNQFQKALTELRQQEVDLVRNMEDSQKQLDELTALSKAEAASKKMASDAPVQTPPEKPVLETTPKTVVPTITKPTPVVEKPVSEMPAQKAAAKPAVEPAPKTVVPTIAKPTPVVEKTIPVPPVQEPIKPAPAAIQKTPTTPPIPVKTAPEKASEKTSPQVTLPVTPVPALNTKSEPVSQPAPKVTNKPAPISKPEIMQPKFAKTETPSAPLLQTQNFQDPQPSHPVHGPTFMLRMVGGLLAFVLFLLGWIFWPKKQTQQVKEADT